jgi:hypothetical protein
MAENVFSVVNKHTNEVFLVQADTKGQVRRFLVDGFEINKASAMDVMKAMQSSAKILDASSVADDGAAGDEPPAADSGGIGGAA